MGGLAVVPEAGDKGGACLLSVVTARHLEDTKEMLVLEADNFQLRMFL